MGRFVWLITWERDKRDQGEPTRSAFIVRWAIIGLAVIGVVAIILWRTWQGS